MRPSLSLPLIKDPTPKKNIQNVANPWTKASGNMKEFIKKCIMPFFKVNVSFKPDSMTPIQNHENSPHTNARVLIFRILFLFNDVFYHSLNH